VFARAGCGRLVDSRLDDAIWQQAPSVTNFKTVTPDFGL
jgi:hypothetical protein